MSKNSTDCQNLAKNINTPNEIMFIDEDVFEYFVGNDDLDYP